MEALSLQFKCNQRLLVQSADKEKDNNLKQYLNTILNSCTRCIGQKAQFDPAINHNK